MPPRRGRWAVAAAWAVLVLAATLTPVEGAPRGFAGLDLLVHLVLFGVLAVLVLRALRSLDRRSVILAVAGLLVFAAADELLQSGVPGRTPAVGDLLADAAAIAIAATHRLLRHRERGPALL